jgi:hypothetical protein
MNSELMQINNNYQRTNPSYLHKKITKKNITYFEVKDGYFNYIINMFPLKCQCTTNKYCQHICYLLKNVYSFNDLSFCFFEDFEEEFYELLKKNDITSFENLIYDKLDSDDCGICLSKLTESKNKLILSRCKSCKKYLHKQCIDKWIKNNEICIYCKQSF